MFDFRDVAAASKAEQIRAWAVEQAADILEMSAPSAETVINMASKIEDYVVNGKESTS